ncbi:MAG: Smr/MutS family protein [Deltaproteobacteria bacterium]|nr:Smr/MutS family protein [Deltaproteobacteria bacterium]
MKETDDPLKHNPFGSLKPLLKGKVESRPAPVKSPAPKPVDETATENDKTAFQDAMKGVRLIAKDKHAKEKKAARPPHIIREPEVNVMEQLEDLVKYGEGFIISNTPEYMEGTGRDIPPEFAERLHRGDFSIQAHMDLHGMGVAQAKDAFEEFLNRAIMTGKRAVLIIHGRGLSSPGEPILKNKVSDWLTRSHWRKWVIAFTSAQSYDGGTGATYVLLRHRPVSGRSGKGSQQKRGLF